MFLKYFGFYSFLILLHLFCQNLFFFVSLKLCDCYELIKILIVIQIHGTKLILVVSLIV